MNAVKGMPENPLGRSMLKKLKIYNDENHDHCAKNQKKRYNNYVQSLRTGRRKTSAQESTK